MRFLLALLFLSSLLLAAPAPKVKPKPSRPSIVGTWSMCWKGHTYFCYFGKDGTYSSGWEDAYWRGTWKLEGDTLTVTEIKQGVDSKGYPWVAILAEGKLESKDSKEFSLRHLPSDRPEPILAMPRLEN